jgi:hypothetical protein
MQRLKRQHWKKQYWNAMQLVYGFTAREDAVNAVQV